MFALGIDLGGTQIKIAIVDSRGSLLKQVHIDTQVKAGPVKIIQEIKQVGKQLISKTLKKSKKRLKGIGIGVAGDIDQKSGKVRFSPNLGWRNISLGKELKQHFKLPVIVDNDANVAAWGAYVLESEENCIVGPSAIGSEKGIPTSMASTPESARTRIIFSDVLISG